MADTPLPDPPEHELIEEMERLEDAVRASIVTTPRQVVRGFLWGIFSALGAIVAVAIIIPILVYFLKDIQWIPLLGTFVERISQYSESIR